MTIEQTAKMTEIAELLHASRQAWAERKATKSSKLYDRYCFQVRLYHNFLGMTESETKAMACDMVADFC